MNQPLPRTDIEEILTRSQAALKTLAHQHVFITGGTGFFGKWLTQVLLAAQRELNLNLHLSLLTRSVDRTLQQLPWLQSPYQAKQLSLIEGDINQLQASQLKHLPSTPTSIFHAAVEASAALNEQSPFQMLETNIEGMKRILDVATQLGIKKLMLTSSGAVYGAKTEADPLTSEDEMTAPDPFALAAAYGEGKRVAELMGALWSRQQEATFLVARCFAFLGPYLPLDTHFAAGNFVQAVLKAEKIHIKGDGTPLRSLQYGTDMVVWLLHIFAFGKSLRPYNVGSEEVLSIKEMAETACRAAKRSISEIQIHTAAVPGKLAPRYTPSTQRARSELGLTNEVTAREAFERTLKFYQSDGERRA